MTQTTTLDKMLGSKLTAWVLNEHNAGRLTLPKLKTKLRENEAFLLARGVVADYAYYTVQHVFNLLEQPIPEE